MIPGHAASDIVADTRIMLPSRFGLPQDTHISVSLAETFYLARHIVTAAASHSRLWLRLPVRSRLNVNHDKSRPSLIHIRVTR